MAFDAPRALTLVERALTDPEPLAALQALTDLRDELEQLERTQVARALQQGHTFTAIAAPLGVSRQAAHRRYRDLAAAPPLPRRPPALSAEARDALLRAREEAIRHGSRCIDSEHLLLAVARTGALRLDLEAARRSFGPPAINQPERAGLHPSLHARLSGVPGPLKLDHLLRAALEDPGGGARRLLDRLGITPQAMLD